MDGFQQMRRGDAVCFGQIGDRAGDAQDAVVSPGRKAEFFHRLLQEVALRPFEGAVFAEFPAAEQSVAATRPFAEPTPLPASGGLDPGAHRRRGLAGRGVAQFFQRQRGRLDLDVDSVQERA